MPLKVLRSELTEKGSGQSAHTQLQNITTERTLELWEARVCTPSSGSLRASVSSSIKWDSNANIKRLTKKAQTEAYSGICDRAHCQQRPPACLPNTLK